MSKMIWIDLVSNSLINNSKRHTTSGCVLIHWVLKSFLLPFILSGTWCQWCATICNDKKPTAGQISCKRDHCRQDIKSLYRYALENINLYFCVITLFRTILLLFCWFPWCLLLSSICWFPWCLLPSPFCWLPVCLMFFTSFTCFLWFLIHKRRKLRSLWPFSMGKIKGVGLLSRIIRKMFAFPKENDDSHLEVNIGTTILGLFESKLF